MSRVGKNPVAIPSGVTVTQAGRILAVKGKLGELKLEITDDVETSVSDGKIWVKAKNETKRARAQWGTTRANVNNMIKGVSQGYKKTLEINGVGFKAQAQGKKLTLNLGFSHDVIYAVPADIEVKTPPRLRSRSRARTVRRSVRWRRRSAPTSSPNPIRARASSTRMNSSCVKKARRSKV